MFAIFSVLVLAGCSDDEDNYTYNGRTVNLGGKTWMAENLNRNTPGSWCYDNNASNCATYGRLYTWNEARTVCPSPWRLPTRQDWEALVAAVGDPSTTGTKLKARSPYWNNEGTDDYGFSALPSGDRWENGSFHHLGTWGNWWSATENGIYAHILRMTEDNTSAYEDNYVKGGGCSVRCVQD
jgi:uncharacterized protein (TIGR02145 family)